MRHSSFWRSLLALSMVLSLATGLSFSSTPSHAITVARMASPRTAPPRERALVASAAILLPAIP